MDETIEAPMSLTGSYKRIWAYSKHPAYQVFAVVVLIPIAWSLIVVWYLIFGLWLVPYRLLRRSSRKNKIAERRHQELLDVMRSK